MSENRYKNWKDFFKDNEEMLISLRYDVWNDSAEVFTLNEIYEHFKARLQAEKNAKDICDGNQSIRNETIHDTTIENFYIDDDNLILGGNNGTK